MAHLKIPALESVPGTLPHRAFVAVGSESSFDLYIGDDEDAPVLLTPGTPAEQSNFITYLLGNIDYDENEDMHFELDENNLNMIIKET